MHLANGRWLLLTFSCIMWPIIPVPEAVIRHLSMATVTLSQYTYIFIVRDCLTYICLSTYTFCWHKSWFVCSITFACHVAKLTNYVAQWNSFLLIFFPHWQFAEDTGLELKNQFESMVFTSVKEAIHEFCVQMLYVWKQLWRLGVCSRTFFRQWTNIMLNFIKLATSYIILLLKVVLLVICFSLFW